MERKQEYWGSLPASYFFLAAAGAMMFTIAAVTDLAGYEIAGQINGYVSIVSFVIACIGSLILLVELTHKQKGHLVNARPFTSVMSFGSIMQSLYIPLVFVYGTFFFKFFPWAEIIWLKQIVAFVGVIVAILYVAYPGIELGEAKGRAFWSGGGLTAVFLVNGIVTGVAALLIVLVVLGKANSGYASFVQGLASLLLVIQLILVPGYVMGMRFASAEEARRGANILWKGELSGHLWFMVVLLGTIAPLVISFILSAAIWKLLIAVLILIGGVFFRIGFLQAAVRVTLPGEERADELTKKEIAQLAKALEARWQEKAAWLNPQK